MPLKVGLNLQKKASSGSSKLPPAKREPIFGSDDSDHEDGHTANQQGFVEISDFDDKKSDRPSEAQPHNSSFNIIPSKGKPKLQAGVDLSTLRAQQKRGAEAEALDPNIYDYDAAYDAIHAKSAAKKAAERADAEQRKPKYMSNLLEAAEVRKRDQLRAQDKLLQREREAEGDEFADKEKFVTGAYKEQQEEVKRMAEEERKQEEKEAERRKKSGMAGFFRTVMDEEEKRHQDAVEAASQAKLGDETIEDEPEEKTAAQLAQEMNEKGANIVINDEGQVADKRQLLTAGLNVVQKASSNSVSSRPDSSAARSNSQQGPTSRLNTQKAMRERQTRMIESQLEQASKRAADAEMEERQRMERASKSRKTESQVSGAKERYLQRKREAAAALEKS